MFQLILGIALGLVLLFVLVLLITEVAATYPVWKQFHKRVHFPSPEPSDHRSSKKTSLKIGLAALSVALGCCAVALYINDANSTKTGNTTANAKNNTGIIDTPSLKELADSLAEYRMLFTTQMKWEEGKMYCNNRVLFQEDSLRQFSDWHYSFLDKDGFLIKDLHFSQPDFVVETKAGHTTALLTRCNTPIPFHEYQRIVRLQVVLDKKRNSE